MGRQARVVKATRQENREKMEFEFQFSIAIARKECVDGKLGIELELSLEPQSHSRCRRRL
jgi:hypothetical protein